MPITALNGLTVPTRSDPTTFDTRADAFLAALPTFATQANALESSLTASVHFGTSVTSVLIGTGAKSFTASTGKSWAVGAWLYIADAANPANYMIGNVTAYTSGTGALTVNVVQIGGSGTIASWSIGMTMPTGSLMGGAAGSLPYQSAANTTAFLAAGTAGLFLVAGASAPSWSSTLPATATATTQPITDNDTSVATGAFVRLVGPARASIVSRAAAATLTAADASTLQLCSGATAFTLTLPAASAVPAGFPIEFVSSATATITISRAGTDTINGLTATALTALTLDNAGDGCVLVSNGNNAWVFVSEPGRRTYESAWTATLPATNAVTSFTHGLGATPRFAWMLAECTTADAGYAVGDRVMPLPASSQVLTQQIAMTPTALVLLSANNGSPWFTIPKTGGANISLVLTSWKYKVLCEA